MTPLLWGLVGFASGSVPFGWILVRWRLGRDVRRMGSGNVGATNVGRALGRRGFIAVLLLDAAKGALPALAAAPSGVEAVAGAALGAVLGHCYTPWLRGQGGKGVATLLGAFAVALPAATAAGAAALAVTAALTRMMSLGSLVGAVVLAVAASLGGEPSPLVAASVAAAALVFWRHRANVVRIVRGTERRIGAPGAGGTTDGA